MITLPKKGGSGHPPAAWPRHASTIPSRSYDEQKRELEDAKRDVQNAAANAAEANDLANRLEEDNFEVKKNQTLEEGRPAAQLARFEAADSDLTR